VKKTDDQKSWNEGWKEGRKVERMDGRQEEGRTDEVGLIGNIYRPPERLAV
jgi:hypothetical protein